MTYHAFETLARETLAHGGGSAWPDGTLSRPADGYMVGGIVPTLTIPVVGADTLAQCVFDFVVSHHDTLHAGPDAPRVVGTWKHEGRIYVDVSEWVADRVRAVGLAHERGELAIWDCYHGNEINTEED